jgi:hypothetical protein
MVLRIEMIKEVLRIVAILLLVMIIVMDDFPFYEKLKDPVTQLILAIIILICIYFDPTFGFIMALVLMVIYYEIYKKIIQIHESYNEKTNIQALYDNIPDQIDFISESHLHTAQNNIVDANHFHTEIKSMHDEYGSVQGLTIGYDKDEKYKMYT